MMDMEKEPPKYLSVSGADTWNQCHRKWQTIYLIGIRGEPSLEAMIGTFTHGVLETLMQLAPEERTSERARELATARWGEFSKSSEYDTWETVAQPDWKAFRRAVWAAIIRLWHYELPGTVDVVSTESKFEVELDGVPFLGLIDRVDRLDRGVRINDYKVAKVPNPRFPSTAEKQVRLYSAAWEESTGDKVEEARLIYLKNKGKLWDVSVEQQDVEDAVDWLSDTWSEIQHGLKTRGSRLMRSGIFPFGVRSRKRSRSQP